MNSFFPMDRRPNSPLAHLRNAAAALKKAGPLIESIIGQYRLKRDLPFFKDYGYERISARSQLEDKYLDYVSNVSEPDVAISLELSCFLLFLCQKVNPRAVLDLGSGFSSYVFRSYRSNINPHCTVYSVDDDKEWLSKTGDFLIRQNLSTDNLLTWDEFVVSQDNEFDVILHDIGKGAGRVSTFLNTLDFMADHGILILDDMQKARFREPIKQLLLNYPLSINTYDVSNYTRDQYGRYAWVVTRRPR